MKQIGALLTVVVVTLLLRSTALSALAARGVVLDVLAFAVTIWALRNGETWGSTCGFFLGLAADFDAAHWLGRHALALTLIGYGVGRLSNTLVRDSPLTQLVLIALATALHQIWVTAFDATGGVQGLPWFAGRVLLATVTTAPIGVLLLLLTRLLRRRGGYGHAPGTSAAG